MFTLGQLAKQFNAELQGDSHCEITGISTLQAAKSGDLSFLHNPKYQQYLHGSQASVVILNQEFAKHYDGNALICDDPHVLYAKIAPLFANKPAFKPGIHPSAIVSEDCQIADGVHVGPNAVIETGVVIEENVVIGANCVVGERCHIAANSFLWPNVTLYYDCGIGKNVVIQSGAVIGSMGFGIVKENDEWIQVPQLGRVVIGNNVSIGANTTIDRGALEDTEIADGVQLDNLIQIAHNVKIGEDTAIAACTGIAGSSTIGKNCLIAGGVGIAGHLTITDNVVITAKSGVSRSITEPGMYSSGMPTSPSADWRKSVARFRQLDKLAKQLHKIEEKLK